MTVCSEVRRIVATLLRSCSVSPVELPGVLAAACTSRGVFFSAVRLSLRYSGVCTQSW